MITDYEQYTYSEFYEDMRKIDLFKPASSNGTCLLFIHGGGWSAGNKEQWHEVCRFFTKRGYVCASMSYRLVPDYIYPSQIEDARLAMQFLRRNAARFGYHPQSIAAIGSSAGGYLAVMLGLIKEDDETGVSSELEIRDTSPQAVVGYCPVVTLFTGRQTAHRLMGGTPAQFPDRYLQGSPDRKLEQNSDDLPPFLLIQGDVDQTTTLINTSKFCNQMNESGGTASLVVLPGVKHGFSYGVQTEAQKQSIAHVELFLNRYGLSDGTRS